MNLVIRVFAKDRARAWGLLVRHSPGTALPNNTFIITQAAAIALRRAGVEFIGLGKVCATAKLLKEPLAEAVNELVGHTSAIVKFERHVQLIFFHPRALLRVERRPRRAESP